MLKQKYKNPTKANEKAIKLAQHLFCFTCLTACMNIIPGSILSRSASLKAAITPNTKLKSSIMHAKYAIPIAPVNTTILYVKSSVSLAGSTSFSFWSFVAASCN